MAYEAEQLTEFIKPFDGTEPEQSSEEQKEVVNAHIALVGKFFELYSQPGVADGANGWTAGFGYSEDYPEVSLSRLFADGSLAGLLLLRKGLFIDSSVI